MKFNKKIILFLLCILLILNPFAFSFALTPYNIDLPISSEAVYFVNRDTKTVVYDKNRDLKMPAASLVKMMTVILVLESRPEENVESLLNERLVAKQYIFDRLYKKNASVANIKLEEVISVKDALYATMLSSASDAAMMLADFASGGEIDTFVEKMNQKAQEIGMENTHIVDPDGLDEKNESCAHDIYLLTEYCLKNPVFEEIATSGSYMMAPTNKHPEQRKIQHTNRMMNKHLGGQYFDERIRGIKTASFDGKKSLVSLAKDDEYEYILVTLGAPPGETNNAYKDASNLYKWAFKHLKFVTVGAPGTKTIPNNIKVKMGKDTDSVILTPKEQIVDLLPKYINPSTIFWDTSKLPTEINAPIAKGQVIGQVDLKLSDQIIKTVDVVAATDIELNILGLFTNIVRDVILSWWFISLVIISTFIIVYRKITKRISEKNKVNHYSRMKNKNRYRKK